MQSYNLLKRFLIIQDLRKSDVITLGHATATYSAFTFMCGSEKGERETLRRPFQSLRTILSCVSPERIIRSFLNYPRSAKIYTGLTQLSQCRLVRDTLKGYYYVQN